MLIFLAEIKASLLFLIHVRCNDVDMSPQGCYFDNITYSVLSQFCFYYLA